MAAGSVSFARGGSSETLTASQLWDWRSDQLRQGGSHADFDWLLDCVGGLDWAAMQRLRLQPRGALTLRCSRAELGALWRRYRRGGEPLQYLAGCCPWRDLLVQVAPGVLIPRPETEQLIDLALDALAEHDRDGCWADLGTGSGCLALALARALPAWQGWAVDCSPEALRQAASNLQAHGLATKVQLVAGSWWEPLAPYWGRLDLVVANPPYIPSSVVEGLDPTVRCHEPRLALDGGADGLASIRPIAAHAGVALSPGGWLLLEHHHDQSEAVAVLLTAAGLIDVQARCDLEGQRRFAIARRAPLG